MTTETTKIPPDELPLRTYNMQRDGFILVARHLLGIIALLTILILIEGRK